MVARLALKSRLHRTEPFDDTIVAISKAKRDGNLMTTVGGFPLDFDRAVAKKLSTGNFDAADQAIATDRYNGRTILLMYIF